MSRSSLNRTRSAVLAVLASCVSILVLTGSADALKVDGAPNKAATQPVNLQVTPTDAFMRIRGWSLPAPLLPLALLGSFGGKGTISGDGVVNIPGGQVSSPSQFQFPRDINGEEETMTISLYGNGDWNGQVNPLDGNVVMNVPMTLKIEASHVRMVDLPWPGGWIYGNIECTVPMNFGPMTSAPMVPPDPAADPAPVAQGTPYDSVNGQFSVITNSMTIGGFNCTRPDIGGGKVEDELNGALAIPSPPGRTDARFNMTFLEGGNIVRPKPAIRPDFSTLPGAPLSMAFDAGSSYSKAGAIRYAWDMNGDGTIDVVSESPTMTQEFPSPGTHKIGLLVVDKDGDVSPWATRDVVVSEKAGPGVPKLAPLKIMPKMRKAKPGSKVGFRVRVKNAGLATASGVRVCARTGKAAKRLLKMKKRCVSFGDLAPGQAKSKVIRIQLKMKARNRKRIPLRFRATAGPGLSQMAKGRIKVMRR